MAMAMAQWRALGSAQLEFGSCTLTVRSGVMSAQVTRFSVHEGSEAIAFHFPGRSVGIVKPKLKGDRPCSRRKIVGWPSDENKILIAAC